MTSLRTTASPSAAALMVGLAAVILSMASGCAASKAPPRAARNVAQAPPRDRMGSLPFPGRFTLYRAADPQRLGIHRYERPRRVFRKDEGKHGIIYTTRAGFLDVGHVRITIDHVRYCAEQFRAALRGGAGQLELTTIEGSTFFVTIRYPLGWSAPAAPDVAPFADERLIDELSIRAGQRLAYLMMTWHEVVTWYGWRTVPLFTEQHSAFTYDDAMSHVIGLRVAGRALRDDTRARTFDDAVTIALCDELLALGAVPPEQTMMATRAVEGLWWSQGRPLKRQLDVGLADNIVRPWLVAGVLVPGVLGPDVAGAGDAPASGEPFVLPTLADVAGRDFSELLCVRIDPNIPVVSERLREALPARPLLLRADRDLPLLIEAMRRQMRAQFGHDVDRPTPAARTTRSALFAQSAAWTPRAHAP